MDRPGLDCESLAFRGEPDPPEEVSEPEPAEHNPLRMLRAGVTVRPKIRGNKHNFSGFSTIERSHVARGGAKEGPSAPGNTDLSMHQTLPKGFKHQKVPPPVKPKPSPLVIPNSAYRANEPQGELTPDGSSDSGLDAINLLPLPPRDRTRPLAALTKPRHQRKHPLIIPGGVTNSLLRGGGHIAALAGSDKSESSSPGRLVIQHTHNPQLESHSAPPAESSGASPVDGPAAATDEASSSSGLRLPPAKPPRLFT